MKRVYVFIYNNFLFSFRIEIRNQKTTPVIGTVRIFLLPVKNEKGQPFLFEGSRKLAIELDRYQAKCKISL